MDRKQRWKAYVQAVLDDPNGLTRVEAAWIFDVSKATAKYHLEAAVEAGALRKVATWVGGNQIGWVYLSPQERLLDKMADGGVVRDA